MDDSHSLDLEAALQNDASGARSAEVLARLRRIQDDCQAAKRQLSDREAWRRLQAANVAVNAAIKIVETLQRRRGSGN